MYKIIIEINESVSSKTLKYLNVMIENAFDNRVGKVKNSSESSYYLVYEGDESKYPCLEIGMLILKRQPEFLTNVKTFDWIDEEDPSECCDLLELFTRRKLNGA